MTAKTQTTIDINTYCVLWYKYHKSRIEKCCTVASPKDWNLCVKRKTCSNKTLRSISRCQNPPYRVGKSAGISPIMTRWLSWAFSLEYLSTISLADEITKTKALDECFFVALYTMLPRQFADNRIYDISREIKRITRRGRHHSKDVGGSNRHNLRLHRVLGTRQKRALDWIYNCACKIFWCNDRLFARRCRLILKKALNECFFVAYFFGASRVWRSYSRTQPYYLQWPRYLDEEQERHGLKQNPMYIWYMILEQVVPDTVIREPDHAIYNDRDIWMKNKEGTAWNKTQCTYSTWFWSKSCLTQLFAK